MQPLRVRIGQALSPEECLRVHLNALPAGAPRQVGPGEERSVERTGSRFRAASRALSYRRLGHPRRCSASVRRGSRPRSGGERRGSGTRREHHPPARTVPGARRPRAAVSSHLTSQEARTAGARPGSGPPLPVAGENCSYASGRGGEGGRREDKEQLDWGRRTIGKR